MIDTTKLPSPADKIVTDFVDKILSINPQFVDGVYVTGSLSMNDFYSNKSDIDFLVLCKNLPDPKTAKQLRDLHKTIEKCYSKPNLSGSYLTSDSIQTNKPFDIKTLTYHEGAMRYRTFEMAAISLSELKSTALTIVGQKAETLPVDLKEKDLTTFLYVNINSYWSKWIKQHSSFSKRKILLLLFPRLTEWSVLGVARQFCTLQTGKIVSKKEAGFYCLEHLPDKFHPIIQAAIEIRKDNRTFPFVNSYAIKPSFRRLTQTIECVNHLITLFNNIYSEGRQ